jgi:hypothetical protein
VEFCRRFVGLIRVLLLSLLHLQFYETNFFMSPVPNFRLMESLDAGRGYIRPDRYNILIIHLHPYLYLCVTH